MVNVAQRSEPPAVHSPQLKMIKRYKKLSDDKPTGFCFWCGAKVKRGKYCNPEHREEYYKRNYATWFGRWIYESRGMKCEVCGKESKLKDKYNREDFQVHHILPLHDGGELLNPENVQLLCPECHKTEYIKYIMLKRFLGFLRGIHHEGLIWLSPNNWWRGGQLVLKGGRDDYNLSTL